MCLSIARELAYDAFLQVMEQRKRPENVCEDIYAAHGAELRRLDRNFIKEMLWGALRWYSKIYWILQNTSSRDLDEVKPEVRVALIMGTYQIFYMDKECSKLLVLSLPNEVKNKLNMVITRLNKINDKITRINSKIKKENLDLYASKLKSRESSDKKKDDIINFINQNLRV